MSAIFSFRAIATTVLLTSAAAHAEPTVEYHNHDVLHTIGAAPSAANIERDIQTLVDFGTRHTLSETESDTRGIGAARRWIKAEFERISEECGGCLKVYFQSDVISDERRIPDPVEVVSVIAIQRGKTDPGRYVIMSGDIDSRVTDAPQWQFSRFVGDVREATLENVVIDNYFFGVASVSEDGFESPVVFPGAAGAFLPDPEAE